MNQYKTYTANYCCPSSFSASREDPPYYQYLVSKMFQNKSVQNWHQLGVLALAVKHFLQNNETWAVTQLILTRRFSPSIPDFFPTSHVI